MNPRVIILSILVFLQHIVAAQEPATATEQQLENLAEAGPGESEDDTRLLDLEPFRRNPLNLNTADAGELKQLRVISGLQIDNLIAYRERLGKLINIYELQAVPGWDIPTIKKVLPFITVTTVMHMRESIQKRFRGGEHSLLLRISQVPEKSAGYARGTTGTRYLGGPQHVLLRYRYTYKNLLQFGLLGDKDAGEPFFSKSQRLGFDFYSFHFFIRKTGVIQSLALGDFTVNMGQGLIQWQDLAFKKSAEITGIKRQSAVLQPYRSAGEFFFHRGIGLTLKKSKTESTVFASFRKLSANRVYDSIQHSSSISSFLSSGYHRSSDEMADRNSINQICFGINLQYKSRRWQAGLNGIFYRFSVPVQKREEPYNLFAIRGNKWYNLSLDYSYTYKNLHFFGEAATDPQLNTAFLNGILISVDPRVDLSLLYRNIQPAFQSINGNAFTENTYPSDEKGFYTGICLRPADGWRLEAYADIYRFPWLKYGADAPATGSDFLVQLTCNPDKRTEFYTRYRNGSKQTNETGASTVTHALVLLPRQNWRTQLSVQVNTAITLRNRIELLWYDHQGTHRENGFLIYSDLIYRPPLKNFGGTLRLQYFESDGYDSRIYAFENDVLYSFSIPAFSGKGFRYYLNLQYEMGRKWDFWVRWAQTIYQDKTSIGSGPDEIPGRRKSEIKIQLRRLF